MFGGNSNWRGPIWVPVNTLIIRALMHYFAYHGDNFKIECPTGSGRLMNLFEVAQEITIGWHGSFCAMKPVVCQSLAAPKNFSVITIGTRKSHGAAPKHQEGRITPRAA
jgi:hypothetical protein